MTFNGKINQDLTPLGQPTIFFFSIRYYLNQNLSWYNTWPAFEVIAVINGEYQQGSSSAVVWDQFVVYIKINVPPDSRLSPAPRVT